MLPFEFLALAISIIMGLAITRLVSGIAISIRQIRLKKHCWILSLWIINMIIYFSGLWWGLFKWSTKEDWGYANFLFLIIYSIVIYLLTDFLVPMKSNTKLDPRQHFIDNRKLFYGVLLLTIFMDIIETHLLELEGLRDVPLLFLYTFVPLSILVSLGFFIKSIKYDSFLAIMWTILLQSYLLIGLFNLQ